MHGNRPETSRRYGDIVMYDSEAILKAAADILKKPTPALDPGELELFVRGFMERRDTFLDACRQHGSPLHVIEEQVLRDRARRFSGAFCNEIPDMRVYYAVKSNNHPLV